MLCTVSLRVRRKVPNKPDVILTNMVIERQLLKDFIALRKKDIVWMYVDINLREYVYIEKKGWTGPHLKMRYVPNRPDLWKQPTILNNPEYRYIRDEIEACQ